MAITQDDIIDGNIVFTNIDPYKINPGTELEGNTTANTYSLGSTGTIPLQIKSTGSSNTGWTDEQDMVLYGVSITTSVPVLSVGTTVTTQLVTLSITTGTLVGLYGAGAWAASGTLTQSRQASSGTGSQNAALVAGSTTAAQNTSEIFNGSTWTASGNITVSRASSAGAGSQNAAWIANNSTSELFNGSTWTASGIPTVSRAAPGGLGSQNAGLLASNSTTETFNGTTWTASSTLTANRPTPTGAGSQNAGLFASVTTSEIFNGSTWTASGALTANRGNIGAGGGSQNTAWIASGSTSELFNGSTWVASGNLGLSRTNPAGAGSQNAGLLAGGTTPAGNTSEIHSQTLYRPLTWDNLRCAANIGVATNISGNTCNVKLQGFVQNMSISSTAGNYLVVTRNASTTANTAVYQVFKTVPDAEDWIVGVTQTVTTSLTVMNSPILPFDEIKNWG